MGLYGPNCQHECSCKNNGTCNNKDGSCICPAGYYGATCSEGIFDLYYHSRLCMLKDELAHLCNFMK